MNNDLFRHRSWMSTLMYYFGLASIANLAINSNMFYYLPYILILYITGSLTISVGYHRLFCHSSFKTSSFWHKFFALSGVAFMYSSPLQWIVVHTTHHKYSDTNRDPHPQNYEALIFKRYRQVPLSLWKARKLLRSNSIHKIVDQYYVLLFLVFVLTLGLTLPDVLLYVYLPAVGLAHFVGALHNSFSHHNKSPKDMWWLEYVICTSGEWLHKTHHECPGLINFRSRWYHFDLGAVFINLIKR